MPRSSRPERDDGKDPVACERQAVALLARREHSRQELERKLSTRGFCADAVGQALDGLERAGLLDQARFAAAFVESRAARGLGPVRIRAELMQRGISGPAAREAVDSAELDWRANAADARTKRFGSGRPAELAERARQARFLEYRGFRPDDIDAALEVGDDSD